MGISKYPVDYVKGTGMLQCWSPSSTDSVLATRGFGRRQEYIVNKSVPRGSFSFAIELENMFGFCEDFQHVVYGMRHKLSLVRKGDNDAIQRSGIAGPGKVVLSKLAWIMPRVQPNDVKKCIKLSRQKLVSKLPFVCDNVAVPKFHLKLKRLIGDWEHVQLQKNPVIY